MVACKCQTRHFDDYFSRGTDGHATAGRENINIPREHPIRGGKRTRSRIMEHPTSWQTMVFWVPAPKTKDVASCRCPPVGTSARRNIHQHTIQPMLAALADRAEGEWSVARGTEWAMPMLGNGDRKSSSPAALSREFSWLYLCKSGTGMGCSRGWKDYRA